MRCFAFLSLLALFAGHVSAQTLVESLQRLSAFEKGATQWNSNEYLDASSQAFRLWNAATNEEKARFADKMFLVHFRRAEILASSDNFTGAKAELMEEAQMQKTFGGRLEYATKSPNTFFGQLAKLQAGIAQATGADPLAGMTDYLFRRQGDKYIVARQELDPEVKGITVDGVTESEALAQVLEVSAQDGQAMIERTRWVVGPKGKVEETLRRATREVSFDEDGRLSAKPLSAAVFAPDAKSHEAAPSQLPATPAPATPVPTATPAPSSPTPTTAESPAPVVERKSPVWPWLVGILALVVIVAVALKRRA